MWNENVASKGIRDSFGKNSHIFTRFCYVSFFSFPTAISLSVLSSALRMKWKEKRILQTTNMLQMIRLRSQRQTEWHSSIHFDMMNIYIKNKKNKKQEHTVSHVLYGKSVVTGNVVDMRTFWYPNINFIELFLIRLWLKKIRWSEFKHMSFIHNFTPEFSQYSSISDCFLIQGIPPTLLITGNKVNEQHLNNC